MNEQDQEKLTDRNVGQLNFAGEALERAANRPFRMQPGSRADGGMLASTQDLLGQILDTEKKLRHDLEEAHQQLQRAHTDLQKLGADLDRTLAALESEREARQHLEGVIRNVADVVVNGRKAKGT